MARRGNWCDVPEGGAPHWKPSAISFTRFLPRSEPKLNDALWQAYERTRFLADTPLGRIEIRVKHPSPLLDTLLDEHGAWTWAYITAFNPGSTRLPDYENDERHALLVNAVRAAGHPAFGGEGVGEDGAWPAERSLLILGIAIEDATAIGARFGQVAIVAGRRGAAAVLVPCLTPQSPD